jgi:hypothetical protein
LIVRSGIFPSSNYAGRWAVKFHFLSIVFIGALLDVSAGSAADCQRTALRGISNDGGDIVTSTGRTLRMLGNDIVDPRTWKVGEQITVCAAPTTVAGRDVILFRVRNIKRNETIVAEQVNSTSGRRD